MLLTPLASIDINQLTLCFTWVKVTKQRREIQADQGGHSCTAQGSGRMGLGEVEAIFSRASSNSSMVV